MSARQRVLGLHTRTRLRVAVKSRSKERLWLGKDKETSFYSTTPGARGEEVRRWHPSLQKLGRFGVEAEQSTALPVFLIQVHRQ